MREAACKRPSKIAEVTEWLRAAYDNGARVSSVCVGAFVLGAAGLLDDRNVTTHWKFTDALRSAFPQARVSGNRLYVFDGRIATSAGIASGVDLALAMVERDAGARIAATVAREMVVGVRRAGSQEQLSAYFEGRDHVFPEVHAAQDWLMEHPGEPFTIESLARVAGVSPRTLTRQFRVATSGTVKDYATSLRLEQARSLLRDRTLTIDAVAERCGFADGRQLRRLWRTVYGQAPSEARGA
jgi:transcriptional regulator GlxA family with amidase domain